MIKFPVLYDSTSFLIEFRSFVLKKQIAQHDVNGIG
jgi:hypothetical protein